MPALLDIQRRFLAVIHGSDKQSIADLVAGNGLEPTARIRIYRHSGEQIHLNTLRTSYPAVLALVGEAYFAQTALGYRRAYPSRSGNLQAFGEQLAQYLESLPETKELTYLSDVARLEWQRQIAALAPGRAALSPTRIEQALMHAEASWHISLHPSARLFASPHRVLTIWRYAMHPAAEQLMLDGNGESVMLWRDDAVVMAPLDTASFAAVDALAAGATMSGAKAAARAFDEDFDLHACIASLAGHGLITAFGPDGNGKEAACTNG